jgi:hypothetical protein
MRRVCANTLRIATSSPNVSLLNHFSPVGLTNRPLGRWSKPIPQKQTKKSWDQSKCPENNTRGKTGKALRLPRKN